MTEQRLTSTIPGSSHPRMDGDTLLFRVVVPNAVTVSVVLSRDSLGEGSVPLVRDGDVFTGAIENAAPGPHYYWFEVDGHQVNDPNSYTYNAYARTVSGVDVPDPSGLGDLRDVPHGDIRTRRYWAATTAAWREMVVYTPPGYDGGDEKYPVLYLQHGMGEDETGWTRQGRLGLILDNLLAEGAINPFLVVMNSGYATDYPDYWQPLPDDFPTRVTSTFADLLLTDIVPAVDAGFRTRADREHRALAGLSMGGRQAVTIGLAHLDTFGTVGGLSPAVFPAGHEGASWTAGPDWAAGLLAQSAPHRPRLVFLSAGSTEADFVASMELIAGQLEAEGIEAVCYTSPGTSHEWLTWRRSLAELAPLLFR